MKHNNYISGLMSLRRDLESRIDSEIENALKGRGDSLRFKNSLEYVLEESSVLNGRYKEDETSLAE